MSRWRKFRWFEPEAVRLNLRPRFEFFERLVTSDPAVLQRNHHWQKADITDDARAVPIDQPFKAKLFRAPDTHETVGLCLIFDKFGDEFRARYDETPLIVSVKRRKDERRYGEMRYTQRFLYCEAGQVRVAKALYSAETWLPKRAMWLEAYGPPYPWDPKPRVRKPTVKPVARSTGGILPEDAEAFRDIDL